MKWTFERVVGVCVATLALLVAAPAAAQDTGPQYVPGEVPEANADEVSGWNGSLSLSSNLNLNSNSNVVGQTDGFSALFGLSVNGALDFISGPHELRNTLTINESFARTPSLDRFVKNNDSLTLESLYNYFHLPWLGNFGRFEFETTIFDTFNVTAEPSDYTVTLADGTEETRTGLDRLQLADALSPTSLAESVGFFVEPLREENITITSRLGLGARQSFAQDVLVIDDDETTDPIEATELESVFQGGVEGFLGVKGKFPDQKLTYAAGANALLPILNNDPEDRDAFELFRYGVTGSLTFNAFDWLSANYNLKVLKDPQLLDKVQVQNNVMLTVTYDLIERREKEEPEPTLEEKLQKAKEEVDTLEQQIDEKKQEDEESSQDGETTNDEEKTGESSTPEE